MKKTNNILVTGGAGFIGTQVAQGLVDAGHNVIIVDRNKPKNYVPCKYVTADYLDFFKYSTDSVDTVVHLAADHIVEQSVADPEKYYNNNVVKTKSLLDIMAKSGIKNIIFSSSASVYGRQGAGGALTEDDCFYDPENPYASTKAVCELLIKDYSRAYDINYVIFRYFNAAGADPYSRYGYVQKPATHVIPILCNKILNNEVFKIFGKDYNTHDGTCVRDYVHVKDLAVAHEKAVDFLNEGKKNEVFNLGGGAGVSLNQLVKYASEVVGKEPNLVYSDRRPGDSESLVANIDKARYTLGWYPEFDIQQIIFHAWKWEGKQTYGNTNTPSF